MYSLNDEDQYAITKKIITMYLHQTFQLCLQWKMTLACYAKPSESRTLKFGVGPILPYLEYADSDLGQRNNVDEDCFPIPWVIDV